MKLVAAFIAALSLGPSLDAGYAHVWGIGEIDDSPALVVATVESVARKGPVLSGLTRSRSPVQYWEATLRVHRAFSRMRLSEGVRIIIRYISYSTSSLGGANGDPIWPFFEKGNTALFPLAASDRGQWRLVGDEGRNLVTVQSPR